MLDATLILEFSLSQTFWMHFRDSLGSTEAERNALVLQDFSYKVLYESGFIKAGKRFKTLADRRVSV